MNTLPNSKHKTSIYILAYYACCLGIFALFPDVKSQFPISYGEGPILDQIVRLLNHESIYRPFDGLPPYVISNYPPLFHIVCLPLVALLGPQFWISRFVAFISICTAGLLLGFITYELSRSRKAAFLTSIIFFCSPFCLMWGSYGRVDTLALTLSLAAILVTIRRSDITGIIFSSLLLSLAVYTRHTFFLAAPMSVIGWHFSKGDRKSAMITLVLFLAITVGGFCLLNALTSGGFFFHIINSNANEMSLTRLMDGFELISLVAPIAILFCIVELFIQARRQDASASLLIPYVIGGVVTATFFAKAGSDVNYFLELAAGIAIPSSLLLKRFEASEKVLRLSVFALFAIQIVYMTTLGIQQRAGVIEAARKYSKPLQEISALIAKSTGPILSDEFVGIEVPLGRRIYYQPFEMNQLAKAGIWDKGKLAMEVRNRKFPFILLHIEKLDLQNERLTPELLKLINEYYQPSTTSDGLILWTAKAGGSP